MQLYNVRSQGARRAMPRTSPQTATTMKRESDGNGEKSEKTREEVFEIPNIG